MASLRIENASILTMVDGSGLIEEGVAEVTGNEISYVGPAADALAAEAEQVIDGSGCVLLPGLINAHTHLAMTLMRGFADDVPLQTWLEEKIWPTEMKLTEEDVYWGAMLGAAEMLRGGITCFNDMYHHYTATTQAAIDSGIRACPSGVLLGFLPNAEELLAQAVEFVRQTLEQNHPRIHPMLGPHAPYTCPDDLLQKVAQHAEDLGVPIHIHLAETEQEVKDSLEEHGQTPVAHMEAIGLFECQVSAAHCVHVDEHDIEIIARRGVGVAHCPGSNMKLASGFQPLPELLEASATVGLGTDGCASNNNLDLFEEMLLAGIIHKGNSGDPTAVPAEAVLRMATVGSARSLGLGELIGTLEVGKRADMILVDLSKPHLQPPHNLVSHLVYSARADDVKTTIVDGEVVYHEGSFTALDAEEIIAKAREQAQRLVGSG